MKFSLTHVRKQSSLQQTKTKLPRKKQRKLANIAMGGLVVGSIVRLTLTPAVLMWVWNMAMPAIGVATIGYWTAMGLYIIARLLFKHDD